MRCLSLVFNTPTVFSFTHSSCLALSRWDATNADREQSVFLASLSHTDPDANRSWALKIGKGGNIYSFVGPYGETVPRQNSHHS